MRAAWVAAAALVAGACDPGGAAAPRHPNVVLVTVSGLRADRVEGPVGARMPALRRLAAEGVRFSQVTTPAPLTLPAHASLFTGRLPAAHGVHGDEGVRLEASERTLAEVLAEAGYETAAVVGSALLNARTGLGQGFSHYDDVLADPDREPGELRRPADEVSRRAIDWLGHRERPEAPFFLWVEYFDLHQPYPVVRPKERAYGPYRYLGWMAAVDEALGALVEAVRERGPGDDTWIVVTADHGEGLEAHGEWGHGFALHETTLRVPLVVWRPGELTAGRPISTPVGLVDLAPTLLGLAGLGFGPVQALQGRDLGPLLRGDTALPQRAVLAESLAGVARFGTSPAYAARLGRWKLLRTPAAALYDLATDPGEERSRAEEEAARLEALDRALAAGLEEAGGPGEPPRFAHGPGARGAGAPEATRVARLLAEAEGLARLGRWRAAGAKLAQARGLVPREEALAVARAELHAWKGETEQALKLLDPARSAPLDPETGRRAARLYLRAEAFEAAQAVLAGLTARFPNEPWSWALLARVRHQRGDGAGARAAYERAIAEEPAFAKPRDELARLLLDAGEADAALRHARAAVALDAGEPRFHVSVGRALEATQSCREALPVFEHALDMDPYGPGAREGVARCLLRLGRVDEAAEHALPLIRVHGDTTLSLALLGARAVRAGKLERADALLARALEKEAESPDAWYFVAETRARQERWEDALQALEHAMAGSRRAYAALARRSPVFAPVRRDPRFSRLAAP